MGRVLNAAFAATALLALAGCETMDQTTARRAGTGAAVGAVTGGIVGSLSGNWGKGAVAGAAIGAGSSVLYDQLNR
jgi:hypothetical protein